MKKISLFLVAVVLVAGVVGCGDSSGETNQPVIFTYADSATAMSQIVSPIGGTIDVEYNGTPIDGIQVQFPEGALTEDAIVSLGYNTGALTPNEGVYAGVALTIDTGNVSQFGQGVTITVPFENINGTPVPYYVDSDGRLHPTLLLEVDRTARTFTFMIFHASTFTWIVSLLANSETLSTTLPEPVRVTYQTGYYPPEDSFQIDNEETEYTDGGECFGMSAFSLWYFMQKKYQQVEDNLYPNYMNVIDTDSDGDPLYVQDVIATRAAISVSQVWDTFYSRPVGRALTLSDEDKWRSVTSAMENTAGPVLIYLPENIPVLTGAHAVVAYSYDNLGGVFIYDPNHPGEEEYIEYNMQNQSFHWYGLYNDLALIGDYHFMTQEPYENILEDADADFHGSGIATVDVTSHSKGREVTQSNIVLEGEIHSSQVLITGLRISRGLTQFRTEVGYDGSFSLSVSLESGINHLQFAAEGRDAQGDLIVIPNNLATTGLIIIGNFDLQPVHFPDPNLEAAIREAIGKPVDDIYSADVSQLSVLSAYGRDINDLTGLEYCISLEYLILTSNQISDISPLAGLTNLIEVDLEHNEISDITPLANLTNLTELWLDTNEISDISPLANLTSLEWLFLYDNRIDDMSALADLTNLQELVLSRNKISDVSHLGSLENLTFLDLTENQIGDISSLQNLVDLTWLRLGSNEISDISPLQNLTSLTSLSLGANQISDISPIADLTNLTNLHLESNEITDISSLVDNEGLGEGDVLLLGANPLNYESINTYIPQLQARGVDVSW